MKFIKDLMNCKRYNSISNGPTAVFIAGKKPAKNNSMDFLNDAKDKIKANSRPFSEIEDYLAAAYHAVPSRLSERSLEVLKSNVIMNAYPEVLELPEPLPNNPTKKQLLEYAKKNDVSFDQARKYPAEKLGLDMKAYKLTSNHGEEAIITMDMTSQYWCIKDASPDFGNFLSNTITVWLGVSNEDIINETPRFISYAYALRNIENG